MKYWITVLALIGTAMTGTAFLVYIVLELPLEETAKTLVARAGLAGMSRGAFLAASAMGTVPVAFLYAFAGALSWQTGNALPALMLLLILPALGWILIRRLLGKEV